MKYNSEIIFVVTAYVCVILTTVSLLKLFSFSSHIVIRNNNVKMFDFPLLATNRFYDKKRSLILHNNEINIDDVEKIEIITLTKEEQNIYRI